MIWPPALSDSSCSPAQPGTSGSPSQTPREKVLYQRYGQCHIIAHSDEESTAGEEERAESAPKSKGQQRGKRRCHSYKLLVPVLTRIVFEATTCQDSA